MKAMNMASANDFCEPPGLGFHVSQPVCVLVLIHPSTHSKIVVSAEDANLSLSDYLILAAWEKSREQQRSNNPSHQASHIASGEAV